MSANTATEPTMDEENIFSGLKKKKKSSDKKKVDLDLDEPAPAPEPADDAPAEDDGDNMFGDLKKKKKKKAGNVDLLGNTTEEAPEATAAAAEEMTAPDDFSDLKKKKKSSKKKAAFDLEAFERELAEDGPAAAGAGGLDGDGEGAVPEYGENELGDNVFGGGNGADIPEDADDSAMPWAGSDRDYTYDELLSRAFRILRSQNPELAGDRRRYTIAPPQVGRDGNKKTIFANLGDICKRMHRSDEHVISFLYAELGTSGSVDGAHRLIIKGRYTQKHMENVLRRYIVEYVTCQTCKSPDTLLSKENRIFFMNCQSCGSRRSVAPIKSGFQAQVGRRRAQKVA